MDRVSLKNEAKRCMRESDAHPYITTIIYLVIVAVIISSLGSSSFRYNINYDMSSGIYTGHTNFSWTGLIGTVICSLITVGYSWWALSMAREKGSVGEFLYAFKNFIPIILLYILIYIVVTIGFILLIIPGVMLTYGLSMSFYVLRDNDGSGVIASMKESWRLTKGHKMNIFVLQLSFIPWLLLTIITCGIAGIYTIPYVGITFAKYYDTLKAEKAAE